MTVVESHNGGIEPLVAALIQDHDCKLHEVADIEREHGYAAHTEKFGAHAKKQSLLCFATEFDQVRSVLALQPARTKGGNATAYPTLEPSRPVNVAHSHRMVCLAHDYMLEQATRTMLWSKGPDKVRRLRLQLQLRLWLWL